jgi:AraC-like DNA-binding protein
MAAVEGVRIGIEGAFYLIRASPKIRKKMALWKFSLEALPVADRQAAWVDVLRRLMLPVADMESLADVNGSVTVATTPMGCEFALLEASPQTYSGRSPGHASPVWRADLARGEGRLEVDGAVTPLGPRSIIYGASGVDSTLSLTTPFLMLFIRIPKLAISPRMITPLGERVGVLPGDSALEQIFHGFMMALKQALERLEDDQYQPIEQSMIEFLVSCLACSGGAESRGEAAGARALHLKRICQMIETMLHDPHLSPLKVAHENSVSPRYLQKLFTESEITFSSYIKGRRLERCYADLVSPVYAQLSILEICFRWGFNDAAHFSRSFRERFGVSPSRHRQTALGPPSAEGSTFAAGG